MAVVDNIEVSRIRKKYLLNERLAELHLVVCFHEDVELLLGRLRQSAHRFRGRKSGLDLQRQTCQGQDNK